MVAFSLEDICEDTITGLYCLNGLILVEAFDGENAAEYTVYDETGRRVNEGDFTGGIMAIVLHGNRCAIDFKDRSTDECRLYKISNKGIEHMYPIGNPEDYDRSLGILWMDDTKILLSDITLLCDEDRYIVCHFW